MGSDAVRVCDLHAWSGARPGERRGNEPREVSMASRPNLPPEESRRFGGGSEETGRERYVGPAGPRREGGRAGVADKGEADDASEKAAGALEGGEAKLASAA